MINNIRSSYLIKDKILDFLPINTILKIFKKGSKKMLKSLELNPNIYELFYNINKDFESYDDYLDNDMLSLIYHLSLLQKNIELTIIKEYYFRYLREQENITVYYDNTYFKELLTFLQNRGFQNNLIIQINDLKIDLDKYTDIDIYSSLIKIEFVFNIKWVERDKTCNLSYIKDFLSKKIIGINSANCIKKIKFLEPINLNDETHLEFYNYLLLAFPNCEFNIQCNYITEPTYWSELAKFHQLKIILGNISKNDENNESIGKNYSYVPYTNLQISQINKNISSINNLHDLYINYNKKNINLTDKYINDNNIIKPEKIVFEDFEYDYKKKYFGELNGIIELILIQKIFKNTNFPIYISDKLQSLLVLQLEKINILEDHLVNIIKNNPLLEIFEIKKNFSGYVYDKKLANALNNLKYLKILSTHFFWYKINLRSKELFKDFHIQENQFFKYLKSDSIKYLNISNESNINIHTIEINLPNLIRLSIEVANLITYDIKNEKIDLNFIKNKNKYSNKSNMKNIIYNKDNVINEENSSFKNLRFLNLLKVLNFGSFLKNIVGLKNLENLSLIFFDKKLFEIFIKESKNMDNINCLTIIPDFGEKLTSRQSEPFIKNIHNFKNITKIELGIHTMDDYLINLLYNELYKLKELRQIKIIIEIIFEKYKQFLEEKMNHLKNEKDLLDLKIIYKERKYKI